MARDEHSPLRIAVAVPIALVVLGVFGWVLVQQIAPPLLQVLRATQWVEVEALVISSRTVPVHPGSQYLRVEILYTYEWDGETHQGDRYQFFSWDGGKERVRPQNIVDKYPAGDPIRVFVNPVQPEQSVIRRGLTMSARGNLFVVAICSLIAIAGLRELFGYLLPPPASLGPGRGREVTFTFGRDVDELLEAGWAGRPADEARRDSTQTTALNVVLAVCFLVFWFGMGSSLVFTQWQERPRLLFLPLIPTLAPLWIGLLVWNIRRRSTATRLVLKAQLPDGVQFGRRVRIRYRLKTRHANVTRIVFSLEGHRWPPRRSIENLRRFFYRTPSFVIEDATHLHKGELWIDLPADPRPADIHGRNDIGWFLKALIYTGPETRVARVLELARFPARSREMTPWERTRAQRVLAE